MEDKQAFAEYLKDSKGLFFETSFFKTFNKYIGACLSDSATILEELKEKNPQVRLLDLNLIKLISTLRGARGFALEKQSFLNEYESNLNEVLKGKLAKLSSADNYLDGLFGFSELKGFTKEKRINPLYSRLFGYGFLCQSCTKNALVAISSKQESSIRYYLTMQLSEQGLGGLKREMQKIVDAMQMYETQAKQVIHLVKENKLVDAKKSVEGLRLTFASQWIERPI